jgi:hypothetical protein
MSAETLARKNGPCHLCPDPIVAGEDYIARVGAIGWVHSLCAQGYQRVMAEHEPSIEQPREESAS